MKSSIKSKPLPFPHMQHNALSMHTLQLDFNVRNSKIKAFADDIVVMLEELLKNWATLKVVIDEFSLVSGLIVNKRKTKIMTFNIPNANQQELKEMTQFEITKK
uniref:Uncharacterized protein n=1 Tax=Sphaerodactylus townsendi TaxID=933632 RepID=A0ACB8F7X5_9SAUR